ncbi:vascular endothelial growth factor D [Ambystoma mexicanum]|uniref:vascular endothelial growth factor D n=1 Tax=Ambystoma mexicanum TaxID=8296 RepID=UPI0037E82D00
MQSFWVIVHVSMVSFLHLLQCFEGEYSPLKGAPQAELEQRIRAATSLEELLQITHPKELKLWRCRSKLRSFASVDSRSPSHRSTRFAAAFYDIEILNDIDEEWQKTQCMPRETSVDVAKELGSSSSTFFKPPCVSVFRCGGCCNEESLTCVNTSASYASKTVFEISVPFMQVEPVMIKIANHTACKCLPSTARSPYSIIRRSVRHPAEEGCPHAAKHCPIGWIWENSRCECVMQENPNKKPREELAICGPHMEFEDSCECVCKRTCTRHYVLNPHNCTCECRENLDSCFLKQKIFHPDTCSCEDGCPFQAKLCANGKLVCAKYFRCPKERRLGSNGTQK